MLEPRIETKAAIPLMGMETTFISAMSPDSNAAEVIGPHWERFNARRPEITGVAPEVSYGFLCYGDAPNPARDDEYRYLAGLEVAPGTEVLEGMITVEIPADLFAVFEHKGPIWTFHQTLQQIYQEWLPASDYEGNGLGDVERYDPRWVFDSEDSVFEYWVGVKPKG